MTPINNLIEMRTISYSCRYLFAGDWHTATASIDKNAQQVNIYLSPSYNGHSSEQKDFDGSRLLEHIVDDYINDLCSKDHYLCLQSELISYVAEEIEEQTGINRRFFIRKEEGGYRCKLVVNKSGSPIEIDDVFSEESSIIESFNNLRIRLEGH